MRHLINVCYSGKMELIPPGGLIFATSFLGIDFSYLFPEISV